MNMLWLMLLVVFSSSVSSNGINTTRPDVVNIGAILSFNSLIGKVAKVAINAAVEDVNSNSGILNGTKLKVAMQDTKDSDFLGIIEERHGGHNWSTILSDVSRDLPYCKRAPCPSFVLCCNRLHLDITSIPFFVRTTQSDLFQMAAVAELVGFYGWRDVVAIYIDDDFGRNGIAALGDQLNEKRCKISYKAPLNPKRAQKISATYCSRVLTLRMHTPDNELKRRFLSRWSNLTSSSSIGIRKSTDTFGLNTYGLYAYDSVWILARALESFFSQGGEATFSNDSSMTEFSGGHIHLDAMSIFDGGDLLLRSILQVNTTGVTGPIKFDADRNLNDPAYEVINVIGTGVRTIGYWSNFSGLSISPPMEVQKMKLKNTNSSQLYSVIWPGQTTQKPRGWVFPDNGRHLRIGVPLRISYREFVSKGDTQGSQGFSGYCIDVFTAALEQLPYGVPYNFVSYGDGHTNPPTTDLLRMITRGTFDAVVGDITITTSRAKMVDFTQPYIESGLVVVAPIRKSNSSAWAFLRPFTPMMWCVTGIFFLVVGAVVWILERRTNDDFRGPPRRQVVTIMWFSFSTLFFSQKERTGSTLARFVLIIWLFVVLVLNSSYTASLTSILTVEQLSSPVKGIESLVTSNEPIGFLRGSFAKNYLTDELNIHNSRLVPLNSPEEYNRALKAGPSGGGVAAVIDERAYMELFLSTRCEYSIVGQEFTKMGWGFAFPRDSPLAIDMSTAILKLSENGNLQRIHDKWLMRSACSSEGAKQDVDRLQIKSFWGLFLLSGLACVLALLLYLINMMCQFFKHSRDVSQPASLGSFLQFLKQKEEDVQIRSKRRRSERVSNRIMHENGSINDANF
ncbi:hypothetical protein FNV43_RR18541 [Rhamnella rubrinervis]|uniref:Glutamate receptor n=1 Tax=Rhamnella rubrinervis TaxID=2594499 RepID=A0A8K0EB65_9ROSA|nr:hypothetical protein FNV43_RR18541 [Rhamnella rubrinervis]